MSANQLSDPALTEAVAALHGQLQLKPADVTALSLSFCQVWPGAKPVLEAIGKTSVFAKAAVAIVIAIGDAYYSKHCPGASI
jgi:hypothetical protein